jgi:hypothetical protein
MALALYILLKDKNGYEILWYQHYFYPCSLLSFLALLLIVGVLTS